jgi:hypothetical protein
MTNQVHGTDSCLRTDNHDTCTPFMEPDVYTSVKRIWNCVIFRGTFFRTYYNSVKLCLFAFPHSPLFPNSLTGCVWPTGIEPSVICANLQRHFAMKPQTGNGPSSWVRLLACNLQHMGVVGGLSELGSLLLRASINPNLWYRAGSL